MISLFSEHKKALFFLCKFIGLYLVLNTVYGVYIEKYDPAADPITLWVSHHTGAVLSLFHDNITVIESAATRYVAVQRNGDTVINVFEGCNSMNVMIVFVVFILSFAGPVRMMIKFLLIGLVCIYAMNLMRVVALYWVAYYFPNALYFFHKFLFTGIIYLAVFLLWYVWVKKIRSSESGTSTSQE